MPGPDREHPLGLVVRELEGIVAIVDSDECHGGMQGVESVLVKWCDSASIMHFYPSLFGEKRERKFVAGCENDAVHNSLLAVRKEYFPTALDLSSAGEFLHIVRERVLKRSAFVAQVNLFRMF